MTSIRGRLLAWLLGGLAVAILAAGVAIYWRAQTEVDALLDYQLEQTAVSLRNQSLLSVAIGAEAIESPGAEMVVQIWDRASGLVYVSDRARQLPLVSRRGFSDLTVDGVRWRVYAQSFGPRAVQVAQPEAVRLRLSARAAFGNVAPFLLLLPFAGLVVWFGVGRGLAPLTQLAAQIRSRTPRTLSPLPEQDLPDEVRPLAHALNDLLERLEAALDAQRQFVADAAHELRTPLTAVRLQTQLLDRAASEADKAEALDALREGLRRASHLTEQLLVMARLDPDAAVPRAELDLAQLARAVVAELEPLAHDRGVDLGAQLSAAGITGEAENLRALLRNLVDNAVRYTPRAGRVDVAVRADGDAATLTVEDTGPGIAPQERGRVFDRFYRAPGAAAGGSGLGLAIVRRVAERHGASVTLEDRAEGRGLRVRVRFPVRRAG
ncbi:MAG: ATP-binding protein [Pseudomonadota bacterium]